MSRLCDKCKRPYLRSNRTRLWVTNNFGHRYGWVKVEMKICCSCMKAAEAEGVAKEINPKWRRLKAVEKIAVNPQTKGVS